MIPVLQVYDVLIVQGHEPFEDIAVGDIIVFNRPSDHNRIIVHRVASILDNDPKTIRTKSNIGLIKYAKKSGHIKPSIIQLVNNVVDYTTTTINRRFL